MSLSGNPHITLASNEIDANVPAYQKAVRYYNGTDDSAWGAQIQRALSEADFDGTLNYASIPVDAVADRLQLLTITGPTDEITSLIDQIWVSNKMPLRFGQFILDALKCGDNHMFIWPDVDDAELFDTDRPASLVGDVPVNRKAKISFADALTTRAFYDDGGELIFVARKWEQKDAENKEIYRLNLYYVDRIEKYWWYNNETVVQAKAWYDFDQDEWPMENPYGRLPAFHFSTAFPQGIPEHKALYGVQDAINKIFQTHIAAIEFLGFPIVYALMEQSSSQGTSDFEYTPIDDNDSNNDVTGLRASPGEVWALRANSVGQLQPSGSTNFIESLKQYKEIASEISGLPARLFTSTDGQHPGADAVNAADAVLRQRVIDRSIIFSEALKSAISFALKLAFDVDVDPNEISILWRPQKIELDDSVVATLEFKRRLGVPARQILGELGYTTSEIDQFLGKDVQDVPIVSSDNSDAKASVTESENPTQDSRNEA